MALIPSLQMLDEQVTYIDDQQSMYDPSVLAGIKSEPDRDHTSCSELMASSLPSFSHTFFGSSYPTVEDPDMLQSWTAKHPDHWTTKEVLDWVFYVVQRHNLDASMIPGENFQNVSGIELCRMRREEFIARDPNFGAYIYEVLQELLQGATFAEPECDTSPNSDNFPMVGAPSFMEDTFTDISNQTCTQEEGIMVLIGPDLYDIDINKPFDLPGIDGTAEVPDPGYYSESGSDLDRDSDSVLTDSMETDPFSSDMYSLSCFPSKSRYHTESLSSICSDSSEDADLAFQTPPPKPKNNRGRPAGQASKGNHLWEFIRDTLKDSKFNPALLKWENKAEGVFRFVQSEAVAQMWGRKKNNPGMTYEKLSRAMRYYYQRGILDRVEGKRLVYKFGKNSHGWQN